MCSFLKSVCSCVIATAFIVIIFILANALWFYLCPVEHCISFNDGPSYQISIFFPKMFPFFQHQKENILNIFNIHSHHEANKTGSLSTEYNFVNDDVDGYFVYYMNTSKHSSITNIYFGSPSSMVTDVYCTFCTLMKFIENKELHTVNLMTVPHELKAVLEDKRSHSYVCNETQKYLDREFCPKYHFMVNKLKSYEIVTTTVKPSKFWMPKEVKNLECQKLIEGDKTYIKKAINNRIKYNDTNLSMKCSDILKRGFNKDLEPKSEIEKKYSIAYASNVYKNYPVIERKLSMHYSKNNHYCYMIDSKSPAIFTVMKKLEKCLPNVYIADIQLDMKSNGDNATWGHVECMKLLLRKKVKFDYLILHQNDDIPLKSNKELLETLEAMNFPNDIAFVDPSLTVPERYNYSDAWTYEDLNIFLESDPRKNDSNIQLQKVVFQKGLVPAGLRRDTVEYMLTKLNITTFLDKLNNHNLYGHDELSLQTLLSDDVLRIPGHIPRKCLNRYRPRDTFLSRYVIWEPRPCITNIYHHQICTWGVEMLHEMLSYPQWFGYRFREDADWGAAVCWMEYMYNKNYFTTYESPDLWLYYNLPQSTLERYRIKNDVASIEICHL